TALMTGVVILVSVVITIYFWYKRYKRNRYNRKRKKENMDMSQPKYTEPDVQFVQSVFKPDNIRRYQFRTTESCEDVAQSEDEADSMDSSQLRMTESCEDVAKLVNEVDSKDNSQLRMTESCKDVVQSVDEADSMENSQLRMTDSCEDVVKLVNEVDSKDNSQLRMTESCKDVVQSGDETDRIDGSQLRMAESCNAVDQSENKSDPIDNYQLRMPESCKDVVQSVDEVDNIDKSQLRMTKYCKDVAQSVDEAEYMEKSQLRMTESCKNVTQSVDEAGIKDKSQLRMTEFCENVVQSSDMADSIDRSQITITEFVKETFTSVDEAYNDQSQKSQTDVKPSSKTESEGRSSHIPSIEAQPILSEEDNLLQAAFNILYTVPRAIEDFVDRKYKGGFVQSIRDHKDQLKATLSSEEWELLSQIIAHHRLYHFYDKIIQDTILDKDVLDLLISKCILRIEDRAQIEHHPKPSDRNKCILDLLIQRPEDSYSVLLQVLKESPTCSKDLIECMEGQQFSHHEVHSQSKVKSCSTGNHSVRLQKNYYNLIQNLSDVRNVIDSLISKGVLEPDDHADIASSGVSAEMNRKLIAKIRSKQDYMLFLEALKEDPVSANAELASVLESTDVNQDELNQTVTGNHSVRLQKNYYNLIRNLSDVRNVIDSLISKGVLEPDDHADIAFSGVSAEMNRKLIAKIRSEQDYIVFLEALKEDPVSANAELASVLESTDVNQDELNQTANIQQLTNRPGFQTLVTLVYMVKAVQILNTEPESHDTGLAADLYRLQSWYKEIIKMSSMDLDKYQQFVQTVNEIFGRISGKSDPVVKETTLSTVMQKQVKKMLHSLKEKEENSELKEKLKKMETDLGEIIPKNIRELIKKQVEDWEKKDKMFVSTRASDYVMEQLQDNSCLTLTAPSGVGKSFIARHTALVLKRQGYNIIPVELPADIKTYYHPGKQTVFIVDDICGNFTANQQQRKTNIAKTYIGRSMTDIDDLSSKCDFFPLLCSLYHEKEDVDVKEYFKNPFDVYKRELDRLSEHGDEGNYKICSLALCVLFNNHLNEKWFQGKMTDEQRQIIKDTCEACEFNSIPKAKLKKALDTLDGTFVCKQNGIYRTIHDKLFDFLAHYFGQKMIECLIDHGDSDLVRERFIWQKSPDDKNSNIDFIIEIPDDYLEPYLERFIKDWSVGKVSAVFNNNNMKVLSFRQKLIQYLLQLDKSQQVTLASTKDTEIPKESCQSGNTPLGCTCYFGYTDMVQWLLHNDVDVDQCRDDGVTGLFMASQKDILR
ncbi:Hypothetical predicted protein, partial [Mytilus galloprovincialis]